MISSDSDDEDFLTPPQLKEQYVSMMAPKLYMNIVSPGARGAMMACEYFKVPVELVTLDLMTGAHLTAEYLKKNPLHTIPVFEDGDFVLHDSHAIIQYLADTYGNDDSIYPKDPKQRTKTNQILFFDQGHLFSRLGEIMIPAWVEGVSHVTQKNLDRLDEVYGFVEEFLSRTKYMASNNLTIADFSIVATLSSLHLILPLDAKKYPKTQAWLNDISKHEFYQNQNVPGLIAYKAIMKKMLKFS